MSIKYFFNIRVWALLILSVLSFTVQASITRYENHRIDQVIIKGNHSISKEAVLNKIKTKKKRLLKSAQVYKDVKNIFALNWFDNIEVYADKKNNKLTITFRVHERPRVASIHYEGNKVILDTKLSEISKLQAYGFLSIKALREGIESLKKEYEEKGHFLTQITYKLESQKNTQGVKLIINIDEGSKTIISKVNIIGNKGISNDTIKSVLANTESHFFSFLTGSGIYKAENLRRDQQIIKYLYLEEGYLYAQVAEPEITLSPTKEQLRITFFVEEGKRYKLGSVDFNGDLLLSKLELRKLLSIKEGDYISYSRLQGDLKRIQVNYGEKGYAFTNVIPQMREKDEEIHLLLNIQKGVKNKIRRINIYGNTLTIDPVIRRNILLNEGDDYNGLKVQTSQESIQRLGFFDEVKIINSPLLNDDALIDLDISVKEREQGLGIIKAGLGYTSGNFQINSEIKKINLFGLGVSGGFTLNYLGYTNDLILDLNYQDPFVKHTRWYMDTHLFVTQKINPTSIKNFIFGTEEEISDAEALSSYSRISVDREFDLEIIGGYATIGRWFWDSKLNLQFRTGLDIIDSPFVTDKEIFDVDQVRSIRPKLVTSLTYDVRNDRLLPTRGMYSKASLEYNYHIPFRVSDPKIGHKQYVKFDFKFKHYYELFWNFTFTNTFRLGYATSLNQTKLPFDKLYLIGGPYTLRGFKQFDVGRKICTGNKSRCDLGVSDGEESQTQSDRYITYGGTHQFVYNAEIITPILKQSGIYGSVFFDIGFAEDSFNLSHLRSDVGAGVLWISPFGPLSLKIGVPLQRKSEYSESPYEFHFGTGMEF